ncbi:hypothetical protein MY8738_009025 [Beauveria namnaoensis]
MAHPETAERSKPVLANDVQHPAEFQNHIYANGARGELSDLPFTFAELEKRAQSTLDRGMFGYVAGGSGDEHTQNANVSAMLKYGFVPRMLKDRSARDMSTEFLGRRFATPTFLCPVGVLGAVHKDGDLCTASAAKELDMMAMYSTLSEATMEEVAAARGSSFGVFQLYPPADRTLTANFVKRAEKAGFDALAITLDTGILGWRPRDLTHGYIPFLKGHCLANYTSDPRFLEMVGVSSADDLTPQHAGAWLTRIFTNLAFTWEDVAWIRGLTTLPIILKGICHPRDAEKAREYGVNAIAYSNHGGRQANGGVAAIDGLAAVVEAAGPLPVIFDSGVRNGVDILRAIALGATMVGVGRPYVYGLAIGGQRGIEHVMRSLHAEADLNMAVNCYLGLQDLEVTRVVV